MPVAEEDKILPGEDSANDTTITDPDTQIAAQDAPGLTPPARNSKLLRILLPVAAALLSAAACFLLRSSIAYSYAKWRLNRNDLSAAKSIFEALDGFCDSQAYLNHIQFIEALNCMQAGEYRSAIELFGTLRGYAVSKKMIRECYTLIGDGCLAAGDYTGALGCYTKAHNEAGIKNARVLWGDDLYARQNYTAAIDKWVPYAGDSAVDQKISHAEYELACIAAKAGGNYEAVIRLNDLQFDARARHAVDALLPADAAGTRTLAAGGSHIVYLSGDGSVRADGDDAHGQCAVREWAGVVSLCASRLNTYGLVWDGTVLSAGSDAFGQCAVSDWKDITAVCAADNAVFGLKRDGTVCHSGGEAGQYDAVSQWRDIKSISAGSDHVAAVGRDGTVYTAGKNDYGQCNAEGAESAAVVVCGPFRTIVIHADGSVRICGVCPEELSAAVSGWKDIVDADASYSHIVAMDSAGRLYAAGADGRGQCDVSGWEDVAFFDACGNFTIAVGTDGSVLTSVAGHKLDWEVLVWRGDPQRVCRAVYPQMP